MIFGTYHKIISQQAPHITAGITQNTMQVHCIGFCIRIRTRGGIYGKIWPEPEGLPKGAVRGQY